MANKTKETKNVAEVKAPVTAPQSPPKRYTRQQALIDTLKTDTTDMVKIVAEADALYVKNAEGGKTNVSAQKSDFDWLVTVLKGIGLAEVKGNDFILRR